MGVDVFGLVAGLGFVLSFGYWCTDFLVDPTRDGRRSMSKARQTPLDRSVSQNGDAVHGDCCRAIAALALYAHGRAAIRCL